MDQSVEKGVLAFLVAWLLSALIAASTHCRTSGL
jgi:hypothetical protein